MLFHLHLGLKIVEKAITFFSSKNCSMCGDVKTVELHVVFIGIESLITDSFPKKEANSLFWSVGLFILVGSI